MLATPLIWGGPLDPYENLEGKQYQSHSQSLYYRFFAPKNSKEGAKFPLVVYLHSNGRQGDDNKKQVDYRVKRWTEKKIQDRWPNFLIAPQMPSGQWVDSDFKKGNYQLNKVSISKNMESVIALIEQTIQDYPIDPKRIYVVGTSLGGFGTWDLCMRRPDLVAAAVPIEGGGDPKMANTIKNIAIWAFHGDKDSRVPVKATREMIAALKKVGAKPKYTEYPGVNHKSAEKALSEKSEVYQWLFSQAKKTTNATSISRQSLRTKDESLPQDSMALDPLGRRIPAIPVGVVDTPVEVGR